ncbi:hypothetical protein TNCV_698701 [Trichonephila clavipes]|nr:hypothetical protein TNCV_698701 [Trichonephila clavipes]
MIRYLDHWATTARQCCLKQCANIRFRVFLKTRLLRRWRCLTKHTETIPAPEKLIPWLKRKSKRHLFVNLDERNQHAMKQLKDLSKNGSQECFG